MTLKQIAKEIANKAKMPYCWEDIYYRLKKGIKLPFELED